VVLSVLLLVNFPTIRVCLILKVKLLTSSKSLSYFQTLSRIILSSEELLIKIIMIKSSSKHVYCLISKFLEKEIKL